MTNEDSTTSAHGCENGERYASFFHHHPLATYSVDRSGYYTDANDLALEMIGLTLEQMKETHFSQLIHPDDLHLIEGGFVRALAGQRNVIEARVRPPGGDELVDVRVTAIPVFLDGEVVGVHGVSEDTTEAKQILRELEDANTQLEQANAAKTLFIANVSHEIRTPLSAIVGATELLLDAELDARSEHLVRMVLRNSERLSHLVNDVLNFSGLEANLVSLRLRPFDVRALVDGVADWASLLASNRALTITFDVNEAVPTRLVGDALRVEQVLSNLVENAIKFTDTGGVDVRVSSRPIAPTQDIETADLWVEFTVVDTGIGIPEERMQELFEPFTQIDPSATRAYRGVGLGLAICRDLVDLMGGQLQTVPTVGAGTTFTFGVPMGRIAGRA